MSCGFHFLMQRVDVASAPLCASYVQTILQRGRVKCTPAQQWWSCVRRRLHITAMPHPANTYEARTARADEPADAAFLAALPKAELHLHIEGTFEAELMFAIAQRNKLTIPYADAAAVKAAYKFTDLQSFLDIYYAGAGVLLTEADFYDLTMAYLEKCKGHGIVRVEPFFDPQTHTERGVDIGVVINGIHQALVDGEKTLGISGGLILSFLRHLSEAAAMDTLAAAGPYLDKIIGVGLDSSEKGNPPEKFRNVFAQAKAKGLKLMAHAGEEGPPSYVWDALDMLSVHRVDHGVRAEEDPKLLERLAAENMALTVCPFSNVALCVYKQLADHNILKLLDRGVRVTVNSDDPAFFGGYLQDNFAGMVRDLHLTRGQAAQLCANSIHACFAPEAQKRAWLDEIKRVVAAE